ncbi:Hypothetical protein, putative, partial [Bodo saltans]
MIAEQPSLTLPDVAHKTIVMLQKLRHLDIRRCSGPRARAGKSGEHGVVGFTSVPMPPPAPPKIAAAPQPPRTHMMNR